MFQRRLHLQTLRQFTHIVVPLRGGQDIQLCQRLSITIAAGEIQRIGVCQLRIRTLFLRQSTEQSICLFRLPSLTQRLRIVVSQPDVIRIHLLGTTVFLRRLMPLLLLYELVGLLLEHIELQTLQRAAQLVLLAAWQAVEIGQRLFRRLALINIHQTAYRTAAAGIQPQRLLVETFGGSIIFTRHRNVAQANYRAAVTVVYLSRLLVFLLCQRQVAGFQRLVTFIHRQPVTVALDQALPFTAAVAAFIGLQGLTKQAQRLWTITDAGIGLPKRAQHVGVIG